MARKPKILFLFSRRGSETSTKFGGFTKRLKNNGALAYTEKADVAALEDLLFSIENGNAKVIDLVSKGDIASYDLVYFKQWENMPNIAAATAIYLHSHGVPFLDSTVIRKGDPDKLVTHFILWQNFIPVANTLYFSSKNLETVLDYKYIKYPVVVKSTTGQKGKDNYLIKSKKELIEIYNKYSNINFLVQEFIPNNGDFRIQVYGYKAALAIKRVGAKGTHLNNTSAGGKTIMQSLSSLNEEFINMAEDSAKALDLQIAGVDLIENKKNKKRYILEVNQGSQIVTGSPEFVQKNIPKFDEFMKKAVKRRFTKKNFEYNLPKTIIGRHELVGLPEFGITDIAAKTDTGAYHSALHAEKINVTEKKGQKILNFCIPVFENGHHKTATLVKCQSDDFSEVDIKNSFGGWQKRYKINTEVEINGKKFETQLTLTNRETQKVPMLLGRRLLRGNFLVNVELSRKEVDV